MGTVGQKDLDWIERAPVSFSGSVTTTASPQAVFAILADHERWPDWFPLLKKEEVLGPRREGVGIRRVATFPGAKIEELFIAWDPGQQRAPRWAGFGSLGRAVDRLLGAPQIPTDPGLRARPTPPRLRPAARIRLAHPLHLSAI
jgi:Polyketide cyclase / dehydrase and lipid transport